MPTNTNKSIPKQWAETPPHQKKGEPQKPDMKQHKNTKKTRLNKRK